jgi:hypothetical protein
MGTGTARTYAPPPRLRELRCRAPKIPPPPGREVQCGGEGRGWDGDGDGYDEEVCFAGVPSGDPLPRHGELRRSAPEIPPPLGTGGAVRWGGEGRGGEGKRPARDWGGVVASGVQRVRGRPRLLVLRVEVVASRGGERVDSRDSRAWAIVA